MGKRTQNPGKLVHLEGISPELIKIKTTSSPYPPLSRQTASLSSLLLAATGPSSVPTSTDSWVISVLLFQILPCFISYLVSKMMEGIGIWPVTVRKEPKPKQMKLKGKQSLDHFSPMQWLSGAHNGNPEPSRKGNIPPSAQDVPLQGAIPELRQVGLSSSGQTCRWLCGPLAHTQ